MGLAGDGLTTTWMIIYTLLPGAIGYGLPKYWVTKLVNGMHGTI